MKRPDSSFTIKECNNCPIYAMDDIFQLDGRFFFVPVKKSSCLTLAKDLTNATMAIKKHREAGKGSDETVYLFRCSGEKTNCTGFVELEYKKKTGDELSLQDSDIFDLVKQGKSVLVQDSGATLILTLLSRFPIFRSLTEDDIKKVLNFLWIKSYEMGDVVVRKGDEGRNLYIIVTGRVEVLGQNDVKISYLGSGEVFGEMSLLSGDPIAASIRVVEPSKILHISAADFREVIQHFPQLQLYFARLLAKRLSKTNMERVQDLASGMTGKLSEMPPSVLFQTLNMNRTTGVLNLELKKGEAVIQMKDGDLINARYAQKEGKDAFYEILGEKDGRFNFTQGLPESEAKTAELGDFMWLLMEGLKRIDEDKTEGKTA